MKLAVLVLKNLSARWLGAYGNEWVATPILDRLAAEGIVFERHIANRIDTKLVSLAIGSALGVNLVACPDYYAGMGKGFTYFTAHDEIVVVDCSLLEPPWTVPHEPFEALLAHFDIVNGVPITHPSECDVNDFLQWATLQASFAAVLADCDARLTPLLDDWRQQDSTIVVTSDLGFPLGEHGVIGPGTAKPHVELVHLPLIIQLPDGRNGGERVAGITQPEGFWSFMSRGLNAISDPDGRPLERSALLAQFDQFLQPAAITHSDRNRSIAIRTREWTYFATQADGNTSERLYSYPDDRFETNDCADREAEVTENLALLLAESNEDSLSVE